MFFFMFSGGGLSCGFCSSVWPDERSLKQHLCNCRLVPHAYWHALTHTLMWTRIRLCNIFTVRKRSYGKIMFLHLSVSHSVHRGGGFPWERATRQRLSLDRNPLNRDPSTGTPPCTVKSGRYASYWNVFLFASACTFPIHLLDRSTRFNEDDFVWILQFVYLIQVTAAAGIDGEASVRKVSADAVQHLLQVLLQRDVLPDTLHNLSRSVLQNLFFAVT